MVPVVEPSEDEDFERKTEGERGRKGERERAPESARQGSEHGREIGADHILHAMSEIDEVHHPEGQRQPRGDEEKQDSELQAVQGLDGQERERHGARPARRYFILHSEA